MGLHGCSLDRDTVRSHDLLDRVGCQVIDVHFTTRHGEPRVVANVPNINAVDLVAAMIRIAGGTITNIQNSEDKE